MAIASTPTLLSLDEFASIMGINPWTFNQFDANQFIGDEILQFKPYFQFDWRNEAERLSRESIAMSIADAERLVADYIEFWPAPVYTADEMIDYPKSSLDNPHAPYYARTNTFADWVTRKSVTTRWGYIHGMGIETYTTISASAAVVRSDRDGDGFDEWATVGPVNLPAGVTAVGEELGIYFTQTQRDLGFFDSSENEIWRIRPVKVTINTAVSPNTVTFEGPIWLFTDPQMFVNTFPEALDPNTATNYVTTVTVLRRWLDTSDQGELIYEPSGCTNLCGLTEITACFNERSAKNGVILPAPLCSSSDTTCDCWSSRSPNRIRVNYKHGTRLSEDDRFTMNRAMKLIVARLAVALLPDQACRDCKMETQIDYWKELPTARAGATKGDIFLTGAQVDQAPFPPKNGGIYAWKQLREFTERRVAGVIK